jgi:hypothetical protein
MKKPETLPDIERIYNRYVTEPETQYKEKGCGFTRFRDPETGKLFTISVKEYVPRVKKLKKVTFKNDVI